MQKENPVIKNYILSSKKRILIEEDTPLKSNNLYPSPEFLNSLTFVNKFYPLPQGARVE